MEMREATWHSKVCPCSFRVQFDREKPTFERDDEADFTVVRRESHRKVLKTEDFSCEPEAISCLSHDSMDYVSAFILCKKMHRDAGIDMGIRHVTVNSNGFDTCGCVVEIEFDRTSTPEDRLHHLGSSIRKCHHHKDLEGHLHHVATFQENHKKNKVINHIIEQLPDEHFDFKEDWDGNVTKSIKWMPRFSHDENRNLKIELHKNHKKHLSDISKSLKMKHLDVSIE